MQHALRNSVPNEKMTVTERGKVNKRQNLRKTCALPREICVADVFDVGGRGPESVDKGGQLLLHVGVDVGVGVVLKGGRWNGSECRSGLDGECI